MVVSFCIVFIHEVGVITAYYLDIILLCQFQKYAVCLLLQRESLAVCHDAWILHLMTLQFEIIVIAPQSLVPFDGFTSSLDVAIENFLWHFTANTGRADYEILMKLLQILAVGTWTAVVTIHPGT